MAGEQSSSAGTANVFAQIFQAWGNIEAGRTARIIAERRRVRAEFEAAEAEKAGILAFAIAQREAAEQKRQSRLVASRALAVAAASGGGVSDPTIVNILAGIEGEGAYRAQVALYEGQATARRYRIQAAVGRGDALDIAAEGKSREFAYRTRAAGNLLRGASLYEKYGLNGPDSGPSENDLLETPNFGYDYG